MRGLMMDNGLTINSLIEHTNKFHPNTEIVSRSIEGPIHRYTYAESYVRMNKLANALFRLGIKKGDRVGTLAWNGYRHFELYFGISGIGAVCHTINPRLFEDQLAYIINHANDKILFCDLSIVPILKSIVADISKVQSFVIMTDKENMSQVELENALCYEELIENESKICDWPEIDENDASSLCYTSGTTGNPKGVLYSHRSVVLHSFAVCASDGLGISARDTVLPVVPMFHVNAWGIPYACAMTGAKIVFPGDKMDGKSISDLLISEKVTFSAGVPTVWLMLLQHLSETAQKLPDLERTIVGGSAVPPSMIETFEKEFNVSCIHAWGMTEMSPLGTVGHMTNSIKEMGNGNLLKLKAKQGRPLFGVNMKIIDDDENELEHDGEVFGELCVKGPWVTSSYFEDETDSFTKDGWFRTGDVATIDPHGFMEVVDRSKDVIKSGGEWISSIELENIAVGHSGVLEAAVIGIYDKKWGERPLLICVKKEGIELTHDDILSTYQGKVAKWCFPEATEFVLELPHTATGKVKKSVLREQFKDYKFKG